MPWNTDDLICDKYSLVFFNNLFKLNELTNMWLLMNGRHWTMDADGNEWTTLDDGWTEMNGRHWTTETPPETKYYLYNISLYRRKRRRKRSII